MKVDLSVCKRWLEEEQEKWSTARSRLQEDGSAWAWKDLLKEAGEFVRSQAQHTKLQAKEAIKAADKVINKAKGEEETLKAYEERQEQARKDKAWWKSEALEAERHLRNIDIHFKDVVKGLSEQEVEVWKVHKKALKAKANSVA